LARLEAQARARIEARREAIRARRAQRHMDETEETAVDAGTLKW